MSRKLKLGDEVYFQFAGMPESGTIIRLCKNEATIFDGKYKYPVDISILNLKK